MKKTLISLLVLCFISCFCFAETKWYKNNEVDVFGDPTGHFYVYTEVLSGTYKNQLTSSGKLSYEIIIKDDGILQIHLLEDGKSNNLSTMAYGVNGTLNEYLIQIKYGNGEVETINASLIKDDQYHYNLLNCRRDVRLTS